MGLFRRIFKREEQVEEETGEKAREEPVEEPAGYTLCLGWHWSESRQEWEMARIREQYLFSSFMNDSFT